MLPGSILPQENTLDMNRPAVELQSRKASIVQRDRLLHRGHGFTYGGKHIIIPAKPSPGLNLNQSFLRVGDFLFYINMHANMQHNDVVREDEQTGEIWFRSHLFRNSCTSCSGRAGRGRKPPAAAGSDRTAPTPPETTIPRRTACPFELQTNNWIVTAHM